MKLINKYSKQKSEVYERGKNSQIWVKQNGVTKVLQANKVNGCLKVVSFEKILYGKHVILFVFRCEMATNHARIGIAFTRCNKMGLNLLLLQAAASTFNPEAPPIMTCHVFTVYAWHVCHE